MKIKLSKLRSLVESVILEMDGGAPKKSRLDRKTLSAIEDVAFDCTVGAGNDDDSLSDKRLSSLKKRLGREVSQDEQEEFSKQLRKQVASMMNP